MRGSGIRFPLWAAFILVAAQFAGVARAQQIQFAEPVSLTLGGSTAQFDAYGRRFSLTLSDNERVLAKLPAQRKQQLQNYRLVRGSLDGQPGSWVRLTESGAGIEGAIWDGHELYAVTRYGKIASKLTTPLAADPQQTVVFRLSDTLDALPRNFCALAGDTHTAKISTGLDQYRVIMHDLDEQSAIIGATITRQLEISLIGDSALAAAETDPVAAMLARLNIVEGIFSEQLGLLVLATDVRMLPADADPLTSSKGATLLEQLGAYRAATAEVRARGIAHLVTGKDLEGSTAGIAYVRTVCAVETGVSVSEDSYGTTISALIMAHELGHNLGAEHDGAADTPCAGVGGGFIMAPSVSGYATFSQCSLDRMRPVIDSAECIADAEFADVAVSAPSSNVNGEGGQPITLPFVVSSRGTQPVENARVTVTLPDNPAFSIDSATGSQGDCTIAGLTATCTFGRIAAGEDRQVSVIARSTIAANFKVLARAAADNDRLSSNNSKQVNVSVRSGVDAALTMTASLANLPAGAPLEIYADVKSQRALAVRNAVLSVNLNQPIVSANMPGATCTANAQAVSCTIPEIAPGTTRRLTVLANATTAGPVFASANVSASGDGDFSNNSANATAWVQAERDVELTAGPATVDLGVGAIYEVPYTLRSRGPQALANVTLWIALPLNALAIDSIDADGVTCTQPDAVTFRCDLGALAPDETRDVRLRVHADRPVTASINATAEAADDGYSTNNFAGVQLRVDNLIDLLVAMASGGSGVEDSTIEGQVVLRSNGRQTVTSGTLDLDLNPAGALQSATIHGGAPCELLNGQHARCRLPSMARNAQVFIDYRAEFPEPGSFEVTFTAAVAGDTAPDNDSLTRPVLVRPYYDIAVAGSLDLPRLTGGDRREQTFTVTAGRRALASARFVANSYLPTLAVDSISASAGVCALDAARGGACDFTDLPANSSITVTVGYKAGDGTHTEDVAVSVTTPGDVVTGNDTIWGRVETVGATDLELRVAASVGGPKMTTLTFPQINVVNGEEMAVNARLEITLPAQVSLVSISAANAICSGSVVLRCDFADLDANTTSAVNLTVRGTANGSFVSSLKISSSNDRNAANDTREVAIEISNNVGAPQTQTKSGGGGRMEWFGLALLLMLVMKRHVPFPFAPIACRIRRPLLSQDSARANFVQA
ncbi:MAG: M12 family metallo-peptidase [Pseudomonadota bacterium]